MDAIDFRQLVLPRVASHFLAEHNGFRDFFHASTLLPALPLNAEVGLFFSQAEIALKNSFGAFNQFSCFQLL